MVETAPEVAQMAPSLMGGPDPNVARGKNQLDPIAMTAPDDILMKDRRFMLFFSFLLFMIPP